MDIYKARQIQKEIGTMGAKDQYGNIISKTYRYISFDNNNLVYQVSIVLMKGRLFVIDKDTVHHFDDSIKKSLKILFESIKESACITYIIPID